MTRLPGPLVGLLVALARTLDRWNLLPGALTRNDPMYASLFLANLGSVGIDRTWHHLYEWGTVSVFGVLGPARKEVVVGDDGLPVVRDTASLRWSFDERINDGFYCALALRHFTRIVEDPEKYIGPPTKKLELAEAAAPEAPANGANGKTAASSN